MKQSTPSLEYYGAFSQIFLQQIHQLIQLGHQYARSQIESADSKGQQEPAITGFIVGALQRRKTTLHRNPGWIEHYSFHDDKPVEYESRTGTSRFRADIVIEWSFTGSPEFIIEAKRLKTSTHVHAYVGGEGMGCFVSGRYASRYDAAAMLGYVQNDSLTKWNQKVKAKVDKESTTLSLVSSGISSDPSALPLEWISSHVRPSIGRNIELYHILLDCRVSL